MRLKMSSAKWWPYFPGGGGGGGGEMSLNILSFTLSFSLWLCIWPTGWVYRQAFHLWLHPNVFIITPTNVKCPISIHTNSTKNLGYQGIALIWWYLKSMHTDYWGDVDIDKTAISHWARRSNCSLEMWQIFDKCHECFRWMKFDIKLNFGLNYLMATTTCFRSQCQLSNPLNMKVLYYFIQWREAHICQDQTHGSTMQGNL